MSTSGQTNIGGGRLRPSLPDVWWQRMTFWALHHGGDEPDAIPHAVDATGAEGRTRLYVPFTILGLVGRRD